MRANLITFRADRSAEQIQLVSNMTWLPFIGINGFALVQWACIAVVILQDKRPEPILPRWAGYLSVWIVLLSTPAWGIYFFKDGPRTWNGPFTFWIPLTIPAVWLIGITAAMISPINRQARDDAAPFFAPRSEAGANSDDITAAVRRELTRLGVSTLTRSI